MNSRSYSQTLIPKIGNFCLNVDKFRETIFVESSEFYA